MTTPLVDLDPRELYATERARRAESSREENAAVASSSSETLE